MQLNSSTYAIEGRQVVLTRELGGDVGVQVSLSGRDLLNADFDVRDDKARMKVAARIGVLCYGESKTTANWPACTNSMVHDIARALAAVAGL